MPFADTWFQFIRDHPAYPWSWSAISNNPIVVESTLPRRYPQYPWKWQSLACPVPLGLEMFDTEETEWKNVDLQDVDTDWCGVSAHPRLPIQVVLDHPAYPWDWYYVSQNQELTWDIVQNYAELPWDWSGLSANSMARWKQTYVEAPCEAPCVALREDIPLEEVD
jgi:hypothetical protein